MSHEKVEHLGTDIVAQSDAEVVRMTLRNKDAFALLMERYEAKLLRYIRRLGIKNREDAEDVLQDVFIKVYKNLNEYDQSLSFSSWVYRIAHNETVSHFRRVKVRPEGNMVADGDDILDTVRGEHDLAAELSAAYDGSILRTALLALDAKYRDILVLRYFESKEYEEIADILEIPAGTVAVRLHRAKSALEKILAPKMIS